MQDYYIMQDSESMTTMPLSAIGIALTQVSRPHDSLASYRRIAAEVNRRCAKGKLVVVGSKPYFSTLKILSPALSITEASDQFLLDYMDKYGAEYVLLTQEEIVFWRPAWLMLSSIPAELELVTCVGTASLFRRKKEQ
jgi:hypothetical protein